MGLISSIATTLIPGVGWTKFIMPGAVVLAVAGIGVQEIRVEHAELATTKVQAKYDAYRVASTNAIAAKWQAYTAQLEAAQAHATAADAALSASRQAASKLTADDKAYISALEKKNGSQALDATDAAWLDRVRARQRQH